MVGVRDRRSGRLVGKIELRSTRGHVPSASHVDQMLRSFTVLIDRLEDPEGALAEEALARADVDPVLGAGYELVDPMRAPVAVDLSDLRHAVADFFRRDLVLLKPRHLLGIQALEATRLQVGVGQPLIEGGLLGAVLGKHDVEVIEVNGILHRFSHPKSGT